VSEANRERMSLEMIHRDQRTCDRSGDRLARHQTDHDTADQAGPCCRSDPRQISERHLRLVHRLFDDAVEILHVGARRDLRDHAPVGSMLVELRQDDIREDFALAVDHGGGRLITTRFDSQYDHCVTARLGVSDT